MDGHKVRYAHRHAQVKDLSAAITALKPTCLIGVSGQPRTFTSQILTQMAELNRRPIIFALSNPTSKAECTAEEAYAATGGRAVFASGSPFAPVACSGQTLSPGQCNNAYIFPGLGLGILASSATRVSDQMFIVAARTLAQQVSTADLACGRIFPALPRIRQVSAEIAFAVAELAFASGLAGIPRPADLRAHIAACVYEPVYRPLS